MIRRPPVAAAKPGREHVGMGQATGGIRAAPQAGTASRTRRCGGCRQPQRNADFRPAADRQFTTDDARVKLKRLYPTCDV